jgi:hypothetical protein
MFFGGLLDALFLVDFERTASSGIGVLGLSGSVALLATHSTCTHINAEDEPSTFPLSAHYCANTRKRFCFV